MELPHGHGLKHLLLPALNLSLFKLAMMIRLSRAGTRELMLGDTVKFARAAGLRERTVMARHVLKLISIPIVTVFGLEFGSTLAFAVVTETIFSWPGVGKLIIDSISTLDRPVMVSYLVLSLAVHHHQPTVDPSPTRRSIRPAAGEPADARSPAAEFWRFRANMWRRALAVVLLMVAATLAPDPCRGIPMIRQSTLRVRRPPGFVGTAGFTLLQRRAGPHLLSAIAACASPEQRVLPRAASRSASGDIGAAAAFSAAASRSSCASSTCSCRSPRSAGARARGGRPGKTRLLIALVAAQYAYFGAHPRCRDNRAGDRRGGAIDAAGAHGDLPPHHPGFASPPLTSWHQSEITRRQRSALRATLSFLGLGLPPTEPSLGMLIANGFQYRCPTL